MPNPKYCETNKVDPSLVYRPIVDIMPPVTGNTKEVYTGSSIMFHNRGNTILTIDEYKTVEPGEFFPLSADGFHQISQEFKFRFGTVNVVDVPALGVAAFNRVEVVTMYYQVKSSS